MKYKFRSIRINVTNMTSHLLQRGGSNSQTPSWLRHWHYPLFCFNDGKNLL